MMVVPMPIQLPSSIITLPPICVPGPIVTKSPKTQSWLILELMLMIVCLPIVMSQVKTTPLLIGIHGL